MIGLKACDACRYADRKVSSSRGCATRCDILPSMLGRCDGGANDLFECDALYQGCAVDERDRLLHLRSFGRAIVANVVRCCADNVWSMTMRKGRA